MSGTRITTRPGGITANCQANGCLFCAAGPAVTPEAILGHVAYTGHTVVVTAVERTVYAPARPAEAEAVRRA